MREKLYHLYLNAPVVSKAGVHTEYLSCIIIYIYISKLEFSFVLFNSQFVMYNMLVQIIK